MSKIIQLADGDGNVYPQSRNAAMRHWQGIYAQNAGTYTFNMVGSQAYLLVITRQNASNENMSGLYIVQSHATTSSVRAVASSSIATVSIDKLVLTVTTTSNYVTISIIPCRDL